MNNHIFYQINQLKAVCTTAMTPSVFRHAKNVQSEFYDIQIADLLPVYLQLSMRIAHIVL